MSQNQIFESQELGVRFSAPVGWLLQQPDGSMIGAPDVAAVGPKVGGINPVISLTIEDTNDKTIDDLILEKNNELAEAVYLNKLEILSQKLIKSNVYQIEAIGNFEVADSPLKIKFLEVMIVSEQKSYTFAYSNSVDNFDNHTSKFQESLDSFTILSQKSPIMAKEVLKKVEVASLRQPHTVLKCRNKFNSSENFVTTNCYKPNLEPRSWECSTTSTIHLAQL